MTMRSITLFCGSSTGRRPDYRRAAEELGGAVAGRGLTLVYGGGAVGLMGVAADAAVAAGGEVVGVIPRFLFEREVGHRGLTELVVVESMHERKRTMAERSDAFVALPGGIGTLEELFEIWSWTLLGVHAKPCGLLDVADYYGPLLELLDRAVTEGFVVRRQRETLIVSDSVDDLLDRLAAAADAAERPGEHRTSRTRLG